MNTGRISTKISFTLAVMLLGLVPRRVHAMGHFAPPASLISRKANGERPRRQLPTQLIVYQPTEHGLLTLPSRENIEHGGHKAADRPV